MSDETIGRIEQLTEEHDDVPVFDYQDLLIKTAEDIEQENQRLRELLGEAKWIIEELTKPPRDRHPEYQNHMDDILPEIKQELEGDSDGD